MLFLFVEVSKGFSQARVPHRVDSFKMRMRDFRLFFAHFPSPKKVPVESESARQCQLIRAEALIKWLRPGSLVSWRMSLAALLTLLLRTCKGGGGGSEGVTRGG